MNLESSKYPPASGGLTAAGPSKEPGRNPSCNRAAEQKKKMSALRGKGKLNRDYDIIDIESCKDSTLMYTVSGET
jgi:hypothetical protein